MIPVCKFGQSKADFRLRTCNASRCLADVRGAQLAALPCLKFAFCVSLVACNYDIKNLSFFVIPQFFYAGYKKERSYFPLFSTFRTKTLRNDQRIGEMLFLGSAGRLLRVGANLLTQCRRAGAGDCSGIGGII